MIQEEKLFKDFSIFSNGGLGSRARPLVFGEKYWQRWVRSYPEIARKYYPDLMG